MLNAIYPKPIFFEKEIEKGPKSVRQGRSSFVVWKTKDVGYAALPDVCSHRGAKLSAGRVVKGCIECPYHGWQFDAQGRCCKIPQKKGGCIPARCNYNTPPLVLSADGIVWLASGHGALATDPLGGAPRLYGNPGYILTDYAFEAKYNYFLQIENLLDPAHINFVHDGFQGKREGAGEIVFEDFVKTQTSLAATFVHPNKSVAKVRIAFHAPFIVDVSIYDASGKNVVRKNVIYVTPTCERTCRVLFRDVVVKRFAAPREPFAEGLLELFSESPTFQGINQSVVEKIMQQDIDILEGQQQNLDAQGELPSVLATPSDKLIIEFRKWAKKHENELTNF